MFSFLSIGLASASTYAIRNMRLYFDERLHGEILRIKIIFIVFTVAYVTRVVAFITTTILMAHEKYFSFTCAIIYHIFWPFWDVVPLTLIMSYHAKKVKKRESSRTPVAPDSFLEQVSTVGSNSTSLNLSPPRDVPEEEDEVMFLGNPEYTELLLQNQKYRRSSTYSAGSRSYSIYSMGYMI